MKPGPLSSFAISAAALSLSGSTPAWHIPDAMKTTAGFAPGSLAAQESTESGSSSPRSGSASQVTYGVEFVSGGIDRVILFKRDDARKLCVQVILASPGIAELELPAGKVDLPPDWSVERAILVRNPKACGSRLRRWPADALAAVAISGSVRWGRAPTDQTAVDLTISFPTRGSEPPLTEKMAFKRSQ